MQLYLKIILWGLLLFMLKHAEAQPRKEAQSLEVTYNKTTSLVFPAVIKSVDRGSRDILAQKAKGVENILQLKAARHAFPSTNLTVITSDGFVHEFAISYSKAPVSMVLNIGVDSVNSDDTNSTIFQTDMTETQLENYATQIRDAKRSIRFINESNHKIGFSLRGIYIKNDVIFYHFRIRNQSNINYDVDFLRFYIEDKQKVKRTASQQVDKMPVYVYGNAERVTGQSYNDVVYALEKFTIPDSKRLIIEVFEKNGGRNISLSIKNKTIVNARLVD